MKEDRIIYKDLSYKVVGIMFEVYNILGHGHKEVVYEKAVQQLLEEGNIKFNRQAQYKVLFKGNEIARYYIDFIIDDKIVLELKQGNKYLKDNMKQLIRYLKATNYKLAIIANFTPNGVKFYRMLNPNNLK